MKIFNYLNNIIDKKGAAYLVLIDPDKIEDGKLAELTAICQESGVDGLLIGGSLLLKSAHEINLDIIRNNCKIPLISFPGSISQIFPSIDALLYISLISGRNADHIIGNHVQAAPIIKKLGIEPISTGYILVESGNVTTAEYMSGSKPVPRNKPEIAAATALAAEYMGMKLIYLEAGSGAKYSVPKEMVKLVSQVCSIPVMVGGGIRSSSEAREKVESGAKIIVTGNYFESEKNWNQIADFANAIHINYPTEL